MKCKNICFCFRLPNSKSSKENEVGDSEKVLSHDKVKAEGVAASTTTAGGNVHGASTTAASNNDAGAAAAAAVSMMSAGEGVGGDGSAHGGDGGG